MSEQLTVELSAKVASFINGMKSASAATKNAEDKITRSTNAISNVVTSNLSGLVSATAFISLGKAVLSVTADFQKFNAVLGNTLGSASLATIKLKEIQDFAAKTPFGVNELTGAFVKLANSGFKPTGDQMRALGDLAASTGKSFDQLAEAILDAQSGEFERLKEFGVRAKDAGDSVIFTYKGVQTQVEKTSEAIRNYVTNLGNAEGTSGSMAKISATLGGQISNLGDSWDQMLLSIGSNTSGVFNSAISVIGKAINKITQYNEELNTADKYKLGNDFGKQLNRAINPFADKGATDIELAAFSIKTAATNVGELVSKATSGAKSIADFSKALSELKKQGDAALTAPSVGKKGEALTEKTRKAIKEEYQLGVKALQDARNNFANEIGGGNANFGTAKAEKGVKSLSDILNELNKALVINDNQFQATFDDKNTGKINAYQSAIESLLSNGYKPLSEEVINLKKAQQDLFQLTPSKSVSATTGINAPRNTKGNTDGVQISGTRGTDFFAGFSEQEKKVYEAQARIILSQQEFNKNFNEIINSGLAEGLGALGSSIGDALANGGNVMEAAGQSLLSSLGGILVELGKLAIATGVGIASVKKALTSLNPVVAIGAGVALIALGSIFKSKAAAIGGGSKSSIDGAGQSRSVPAFASGIQNFRGGMALVGERGPELVDLPTGASVVPTGRTERMLSGGGQANVFIDGSLEVGLDRLYVRLQQTGKKLGRLG